MFERCGRLGAQLKLSRRFGTQMRLKSTFGFVMSAFGSEFGVDPESYEFVQAESIYGEYEPELYPEDTPDCLGWTPRQEHFEIFARPRKDDDGFQWARSNPGWVGRPARPICFFQMLCSRFNHGVFMM